MTALPNESNSAAPEKAVPHKRRSAKKIIGGVLMALAVPAVVITGMMVFGSKSYSWVSLCVVILSCVPFFLAFEKNGKNSGRVVIIAVMTAFSVVGRLVFTGVPGFKPVTAFVIVTAVYMGSEAGFMTGALTAVISNFYFGQGPWTPFQMFAWGFLGLLAGILSGYFKKHLWALLVYGGIAGFLYSALMDIYTVLWMDNAFNLTRFFAVAATSLGFSCIYAVSNIIFLLIIGRPIGKKLDRIRLKYGI